MKPLSLNPPLKKSEKLLLPVVTLCMFILGFECGGFQLALLKVAYEFRVSGVVMGVMASTQSCAGVVMPLLFGGLSDRVGKKTVILIFSVIFILGSFVTASALSAWIFMAGIFILGTGFSLCESTAMAAVADSYGEKSARYMNLTQCGFSLGAVVGPLFADLVITNMDSGWRIVFITCGAASLILWPVILRTSFNDRNPSELERAEDESPRGTLLTTVFVCLVIAITLYVGLEMGSSYFLDILFTESLGAPRWSAVAISAFWFATMASRLLSGLTRNLPKSLLVACFGISAAILLMLSGTGSFRLALVCCALLGFLFGPTWPMLVSFATQEFPSHSGFVSGVMVAAGGLGGTLMPVLMGALTDILDTKSAFIALSGFALAATVVSLISLRKSREKSDA